MHYLATVQSPFEDIDLNDPAVVAAAHKRAISLGEPLSAELKSFCRENSLEASPRLVDAHNWLRFLVELPDAEPILK